MNQICLTWRVPAGQLPNEISQILPTETYSLEEASRAIPEGAYTTFRTFFGSRAIRLGDHLDRLENTARLAGREIKLDQAAVRRLLRDTIYCHPNGDLRVRLTLDLTAQVGDLYISITPLQAPSQVQVEHGVEVVTRRLHRDNPQAKLSGFMRAAAKARRGLPKEIYEVIMIGEGDRLLEGLSSNVYAVLNGEIWTADEGVLPGVTRRIVLEEAARAGLGVRLEGLALADLARASELFLTSSSRAVLPIWRVDGRPVGSGMPGPITRQLLKAYQTRIEMEAEEI